MLVMNETKFKVVEHISMKRRNFTIYLLYCTISIQVYV